MPELTPVLLDAATHRENIRRKALEGLRQAFPLKTRNYTVELSDPHVDATEFSSRQQKKAILEGRTLHEKVKGTVTVRDASGKVVDTAKNFTLLHLPYFTQRHTFILDGNEYNTSSQIRTKPGIYTRRRGNEDLEAAFNLSKGANFRISMDPEQGQLHMEYGTTRIPLYPVLRALGVPHQDVASHWGAEVAAMNRDAVRNPDKQVEKLYEKLVPASQQTAQTPEEKVSALHKYYDNTSMDPEVAEKTLGHRFDKVTPRTLLVASKKLLDVHRSAVDTDDRDSLEYKTFHSVDDFIKERIGLDARALRAKIGLKLDASGGDLRKAVPAAPFSRSIYNFLTQSSLSAVPMQINPMELLDQASKVTSLGEGAIASERAIPLEARNLHPTHFGIMDSFRTPECYAHDMEVFTSRGWKPWPDVTMSDFLACRIDGRLEFHHPTNLVATRYQGPMYGVRTGKIEYLVTPNHRTYCRPIGYATGRGEHRRPGRMQWRVVRADEVHGKRREFETAHGPFSGKSVETFTLPRVESLPKALFPAHGGRLADTTVNVGPIPMVDWASFMGWYLSEGNTVYDEPSSTYHVLISQSREANPENCQVIEALLSRLPFAWSMRGGDTYVIGVKQLAHHLKQFGFCNDKYIPEYFFAASVEVREALMEALMLGDSRRNMRHRRPQNSETFCTTSPRLAVDFERLAISLGQPVRVRRYPDDREERYLDVYEIPLLRDTTRQALPRKDHYFVEQYDGMVYCAEVPGGLLYVRRGDKVPIWSGNSFKAGIDIRTALSARRDDAGNLYARVRDVKTGKEEDLKPADMVKAVVAFPGERIEPGKMIDVMHNGEVQRVEASKVTHQIPSVASMFGPTTNLIPFLYGMQGNRVIMASKHQSQALPLVHREPPLVQVKSWRPGLSVEEEMARMVVPTSPVDGTVEKIDEDYIYVRPSPKTASLETEVYNDYIKLGAEEGLIKLHYDTHFPLAAKTYLHNDIKVKVGDHVKQDQPLADSNFTKNDALALGRNLRVGYMAYRGLNTNDGLVVSQSAADSLVSEHMYKYVMQLDGDLSTNKEKHRTYFGAKYTAKQYGNLDEDGVIKPGTVVSPGDPVIVAVRKSAVTGSAALLGKLSKSLVKPFREEVETWDHDHPGTVMDVVKTPARVTVTVRTQETINVGDKLAGRYGNKGVVAKIIPDNEMVQDEKGRPLDLLFTSAGIITRINPNQSHEALVGKVAEHLGHPIAVDQLPNDKDYDDYVQGLLTKHGLKDKEEVFDPVTGKKVPGILVGKSYVLKIFKTTDSNWASHGVERYDVNQQPARGGDEGAKAIGKMEFDSLVAHNARNVLREAASIKSQKNDEFWRAVQLGLPTPSPKTPFAYDKFLSMLQGGGVKVSKSGSRLALGPLTDNDVLKMSSGAIKNARMLRAKDLQPESGGLFDPTMTGGESGTKWAHVDLQEPVINPVFEEPVRRLLGQTQKGLRDLYAAKGGNHVRDELSKIDIDARIDELKQVSKTARGPKLDDAVKQIKYLTALKAQGLTPDRAYVLTKLPIAPPVVRPIVPQKDGRLLVGDVNLLYRDALLANERYGESKGVLPESELGPLRSHLYEAVGAVFGTHDPVSPTTEKRGAKGFLFQITGTRPGNGFFQAKLMKRQQDVSGRATIAPDPTLSMDEIGMPEDMLWGMYSKFVIGRLVRNGYPALEAEKMVKDRHPFAREQLIAESRERPVIVNRAPSLHRYNIIGAYPKITEGKTIRLNPFAEKGMNADYDGDAIQVHAPVTPAGVADVKKMTLSNLIFSEKKSGPLNVAPDMEAVIGLHRATLGVKEGEPRRFKSTGEALAAYHRGELKLSDPVEISE